MKTSSVVGMYSGHASADTWCEQIRVTVHSLRRAAPEALANKSLIVERSHYGILDWVEGLESTQECLHVLQYSRLECSNIAWSLPPWPCLHISCQSQAVGELMK